MIGVGARRWIHFCAVYGRALKIFTRQLDKWDRSSQRSDLELCIQESSKQR